MTADVGAVVTGRTLGEVLAEHAPWHGPITGKWRCPEPCSAASTHLDDDGYPASHEQRVAEHRAHVEQQIHAWLAERLADEGVVEAAAEALSATPDHGEMTAYSETAVADHNRWSWRDDGHGEAIREPYRRDARAALAAVRETLL